MNSIEEKLWNYIDGNCTPEEAKAISLLIEQDEAHRLKYQELLEFNIGLNAIELDEPPMAFTYNVMETIRAEHASQPLKASINNKIIKGIGLFFIVTISAMLVLVLSKINWHSAGGVTLPTVPVTSFTHLFTGPVVNTFLFFDVILGLYLFDAWLRKRGVSKMSTNVQTSGHEKQQ